MLFLDLWLIINISFIQARYLRLPIVNSSELSPIGTPIIQLIDVLPTANWEFKFLTQLSIKSYFLLDNLKGTIIIKRHLDREDFCQLNLCSCSTECLIKLEINAISDTSTHILSLPILIIDENDNYCSFGDENYYLNITENLPIHTRISLPLAYDPDLTPNNIQSYRFLRNNYSEFRLENQLTPSMIIVELLDRERIDRYDFDFCAYEGINEQQRSCCTKLIVQIIDINDNSPKFQQFPLLIHLSELSPIGTEVIQIKASDPDQGLNGHIRYSFSKWTLNDHTIYQTFHLNPDNGSIILLKSLDYEQRTNYELQIQAKDLGLNAIPIYTTILIQIIDENDWIPEIFIFPSPDVQLINNSIIYILENISLHTSIIYLTISDRDTNENGRVSLELIIVDSSIQLQKINNQTYTLITNRTFDREEQSSYSFSLIAYDHGQPSQSIMKKFELYLTDINDCSPFFNSTSNHSFYIDENNNPNLVLEYIQAFDLDQNDHITFYLQFENINEKDLFDFNQENQLIVTKTLDYECQSSYHFMLIAEDLVGHRTAIPIDIYLNDLNDNPVRFQGNITQLYIQENMPIGMLFGLIEAKDQDQNDRIIYQIHPDDRHLIVNLIELSSNGSLYTKRRFSRNEINQLQFRILANDSLHIDSILMEILIEKKAIFRTSSPYCLSGHVNETIQFHIETEKNLSFSMRNPSSSGLILFPNGTLIVTRNAKKYSLDIYFHDGNSYSIFEKFILLDRSQCKSDVYLQFDQQIIIICLLSFIILIILVAFYLQQQIRTKSLNEKVNSIPSFSSLLSSPSPQFTAMTIISTSPHELTNQSSSLSNSSSSTYIKMSRSFEDDMI